MKQAKTGKTVINYQEKKRKAKIIVELKIL